MYQNTKGHVVLANGSDGAFPEHVLVLGPTSTPTELIPNFLYAWLDSSGRFNIKIGSGTPITLSALGTVVQGTLTVAGNKIIFGNDASSYIEKSGDVIRVVCRGATVLSFPTAGITGLLKSDGSGGLAAAVAGTDYQPPLTPGTDYQVPLVAGTDYQVPAGTLMLPEKTPVNAVASSLTTALAGDNNDLVFTAKTKGASGDNITVAYLDPGTPSAALSVDVTGTDIVVNLATDAGVAASAAIGSGENGTVTTTSDSIGTAGNDLTIEVVAGAEVGGALSSAKVGDAITVTLGMDSGTKSSADIGAGANGVVTTEVDTPGVAGDTYNIEVVVGTDPSGSMSADLVAQAITVTLGMDAGTKSSADIGAGANGTVTTEVDLAGVAGDSYSIEVVVGTDPGGALSADILAQAITVTLGMDNGQQATAQIGGGVNGRVDCVVDTSGVAGNAWTITVSDAGAPDCDMSAALVDDDITVTLGKVGAALSAAKNTATLIAAAITALAGVSATATGTGASSIGAAEGPLTFEGGVAIAVDATKNTATLIAAAISLISGVTATASGTGADSITSIEGPTAFTGGVDPVVDNAKNTALLIAAAVSLLDGVTATASGDGSTALTLAEGPTSFTGGVNIAPDNTKNTATLVAASIAALDGVTATASGTGASSITAAEGPTSFTNGAEPAITSTAAQVDAAIAADEAADALIAAANAPANSGAGVITAMVETPLAGGINGTVGLANETCADGSYLYHCIAANTVADANWRRVTLGAAY